MAGKRVATVLATSLFLVVLLAAFLSPRTVALADDSSLGTTGGSVHAIWTTDIRMAAETVQAVCFGDFAEYRVDFRFVNEGKARTVKLGFPFTATDSSPAVAYPPVGFQAWENGRPLTVREVVTHKTEVGLDGYFVHEARFRHGATMITVSYLAQEGASEGESWRGFYQYWLHTGSTWKGPIGKAVVRYRFADSFGGTDVGLAADEVSRYSPVTAPPRWTEPLPRTYQWQFSNFEPSSAGASNEWWRPQSPFDVTLAFTGPTGPSPTQATWRWSSVARGFGGSGYNSLDYEDFTTCWAEGVPGPGIGQWVQARFKRPTPLRELRILPGNNDYGASFWEFARPRTLTAIFSDGSSTLLHLSDSPTLQRFPVHVTTRSVRFVIRSVYLGTDYPATCISLVEFGSMRAPGYAPFRRLIADPQATGRLTAWAGPPAPAPRFPASAENSQEAQDDESYAGGDLIGISDWKTGGASFAADAPFKEPASLATVKARAPTLRLPDSRLVGEPTTVNALSYWTYEIHYSSGIDLLVNTNLAGWPQRSLAAERADETANMDPYTDGRIHPFELATIGHQVVGLAQPGQVPSDSLNLPGQVFWRAGNRSYHLYAPQNASTTAGIVAVARSMIEPSSPQKVQRSTSSSWPWWVGLAVLVVAAMAAAIVLGLRRRTAIASPPATP